MKVSMKDIEEIIDFANMVFSMKSGGIDFARLLPKAYSGQRTHLLKHHMIEENGRLRALIDLYPLELRQADYAIKAAYVGTVSVHPNSRGKGYMTELMRQAEETARADGCDMMILDGKRHRYQYYGFERAGIKYNYNITVSSIRRCCQGIYGRGFSEDKLYRFELIDEHIINFRDIINVLYSLYSSRNVTARTRGDFFLCLQSWNADTYAVYAGNSLIGYINISADEHSVFEIEIDDISKMPRIIYEFMEALGSCELGITVGIDELEKIDVLDKMCDYFNLGMSRQVKILNHKNVLEFLLNWKCKYNELADGSCTIGIEQTKKSFQININSNHIEVCETKEPPDVMLDDKEFVYMLTTPHCYQEQQKPQGKLKNAPAGWFPLPFYLPEADAF